MHYHALITTDETGELYEYDHKTLASIKESLVIPYLKNEDFQFYGYFIVPAKVKRLIITETQQSSTDCVKIAYSRLPSNVFMTIYQNQCVFSYEYSKDITRTILKETKSIIEISGSQNKSKPEKQNTTETTNNMRTIFIGYSYRQIDDEFVSGFKDLLTDKGFEVIDGKADGLGSISQAIIEKINISDIVIIVLTKRDKKENLPHQLGY